MGETVARPLVVCVDDDLSVLSSLKRLLRREPFEFVVTDRPAEALELVEFRRVDLLIADYMMPEMRGTDLLKAVLQRSPSTRRVLMTGRIDLQAIEPAAREAGVHRLLSKPWDDDELRQVIQTLLEPMGARL